MPKVPGFVRPPCIASPPFRACAHQHCGRSIWKCRSRTSRARVERSEEKRSRRDRSRSWARVSRSIRRRRSRGGIVASPSRRGARARLHHPLYSPYVCTGLCRSRHRHSSCCGQRPGEALAPVEERRESQQSCSEGKKESRLSVQQVNNALTTYYFQIKVLSLFSALFRCVLHFALPVTE